MHYLIDRITQGNITNDELNKNPSTTFYEFFNQFRLLNAEKRYECLNHEKVSEFLALMTTWDQIESNPFIVAFHTLSFIEAPQRQLILPLVLNTLKKSEKISYEEMKFMINILFNLNKVIFTELDMKIFDDFLFAKL